MSDVFKELTDESFELERLASTIQDGRRIGMRKDDREAFAARYHRWYDRCMSNLPRELASAFKAEYTGGFFNRTPKIDSFLTKPTLKKEYYYGDDPDQTWANPYSAFAQRLLTQRLMLLHAEDLRYGRIPPSGGDRPRVFVVHGHDEYYLDFCTNVLHRLRLRPVVLRNEPSHGRTIIEKFVDYSDVRFAVVLLTGDDMGSARNQPDEDLQLRPRQNVVFEMGFFIGKLGRERVCALHQSGVDILSDYQGVVYIRLDDLWRWPLELARELRETGLPVLIADVYRQA